MGINVIHDNPTAVRYGQFPPLEYPHQAEWTVMNYAETVLRSPENDLPTHHIALEERISTENPANRQVVVVITQEEDSKRKLKKNTIERPLGDFITEEYWQMDQLGGDLMRIRANPADIDAAIHSWIAPDNEVDALPWMNASDLVSTFDAAEAHFARMERIGQGETIKQAVELPLPNGLKAFIHTHERQPARSDKTSLNPYIRSGYRYLKINIVEETLQENGAYKWKRILLPDNTKLREITLPLNEWELHRDEFLVAITEKTDKVTAADLVSTFDTVSQAIAVFQPIKAT